MRKKLLVKEVWALYIAELIMLFPVRPYLWSCRGDVPATILFVQLIFSILFANPILV